MNRKLVLASSSPYRRELLERLGIAFEQASPDVDESRRDGESGEALAARLATLKAAALADRYPDAWILASDQVATVNGEILGKPGSPEAAVEQLGRCTGRPIEFHTAVCLRSREASHQHIDHTRVIFRPLSRAEIERYVERERPLDCAGSFKAEGLGIALFQAVESRDPTGLIGLPLIAVADMLRRAGFEIP